MSSILAQDHTGPVEICVWDDSSSDSSVNRIESYRSDIENRKWKLLIGQNGQSESPHGPGQQGGTDFQIRCDTFVVVSLDFLSYSLFYFIARWRQKSSNCNEQWRVFMYSRFGRYYASRTPQVTGERNYTTCIVCHIQYVIQLKVYDMPYILVTFRFSSKKILKLVQII